MSGGLTLILDRRDLSVSVENKALRIDYADGAFKRVPLAVLGSVVVYGSPSVRCDVWRALADSAVPVALMPARGKGEVCWLGSGLSSFVHWRARQYRAYQELGRRLVLARWMVREKLAAGCDLLQRLGIGQECSAILTQCQQDTALARDNAALMGVEGRAAKAWYAWLRSQMAPHWMFESRNRRPPRDPVNAMLSLGYTLALGVVHRQACAAGFDPYLGFLHEVAPARPGLSLDLMEALRPGVDLFVLRLLDGQVTPADFTLSDHEGCRLSKEARSRFYGAWRLWCDQWPARARQAEQPGETADDQVAEEQSIDTAARGVVNDFQKVLGRSEEENPWAIS